MATGPKKVENRGGARPGAGRPRIGISDKEVRKFLKAAKSLAKKKGKSVYEVILGIAYGGKGIKTHDQLAAARMYLESVISKVSESDSTVGKPQGPALFLPERRPDPAKLVQIKGGKPPEQEAV